MSGRCNYREGRSRQTILQRFTVYRVLRIAGVALPAIFAYRWLDLRDRLARPAPPETWERVHDWVARGLHDLGIHLAGLFVKLCQVVGARADNFPEPFIRRLGRFHDAVPPRPFSEMGEQIERELGRPLDEDYNPNALTFEAWRGV
jgi:ubiquinone biosynthesis protein